MIGGAARPKNKKQDGSRGYRAHGWTMRILFLGTSEFAVPVLAGLADTRHELALVVTAPDRPQGRGRRVKSSPVARLATERGLPLFQPERVNAAEAVARLRDTQPDLTVVVAYGQILRQEVLTLSPKGIVNLHGSLLPHLRGAAPIARGIQRGDREGGVTLQHVVREVDAGDVIAASPVRFGDDETAGDAAARISLLARDLLLDNLDALERGDAPRTAQDPERVTHAPPIDKREGRVPWPRTATEVRDHVRAMTPWPSAFTEVKVGERTERLILRAVTVAPPDRARAAEPGRVRRVDAELRVATGDGEVVIDRLMRSGRAEMDSAAFLRGFDLPEGTTLE